MSPGAGRVEVRLTPALVVLVVALGAIAGLGPAVASPSVTAVLWVGLVTMVLTGLVWPLADRRAARLAVARCASDAVEGRPFTIELASDRGGFPLHVRLEEPFGSLVAPGSAIEPAAATADEGRLGVRSGVRSGVLVSGTGVSAEAVITRRGVYDRLPLRVTDAGPFGLLRVTRSVHPSLQRRLYVGPRTVDGDPPDDLGGAGNEPSGGAAVVMAGDTVRSVRPYVAGDPAHLVHWPTSAHAGELMVRELEPPAQRLLVVVVDLRSSSQHAERAEHADQVEHAVRTAAGTVRCCLERSMRVVLCTAEADGPVTAGVSDIAAMRRRLAAAISGVPGPVPPGCDALVFTPVSANAPANAPGPVAHAPVACEGVADPEPAP